MWTSPSFWGLSLGVRILLWESTSWGMPWCMPRLGWAVLPGKLFWRKVRCQSSEHIELEGHQFQVQLLAWGSYLCLARWLWRGLYHGTCEMPLNILKWLAKELFTIFKGIHEVWMPRTLQNNVWLLKYVFGREACDSVCNFVWKTLSRPKWCQPLHWWLSMWTTAPEAF